MTQQDQKLQAIRLAMEQIEKQYGKGAIMRLGEKGTAVKRVDSIPTGSIGLDIALGVGGLPRGRVVEMYGPEASGKCVRGDTLIFSEDGILPISAFGSPRRLGFQPSQTFIYSENCYEKASHFYNGGRKKTIRIQTRSGYSLEGTPNHRIRVLDNDGNYLFRRLDQLRDNDFVAIQRGQQAFGSGNSFPHFIYRPLLHNTSKKDFPIPNTITAPLACLMGFLVGDGTLTATGLNRNNIQISLAKEELKRYFEKLCLRIFGEKPKRVYDRRTKSLERLVIHNTKARAFLEFAGLGFWRTEEKEIPYSILQAPKAVVASFLKGLFSTDGTFSGATIEYTTKSEKLARQLQVVLLNFGIISNLKARFNPNYSGYYFYLYIQGQQDKQIFAKEIGFLDEERQERLKTNCESIKIFKTNLDIIPNLNFKLAKYLKVFRRVIRETTRKDWEVFYDYLPTTPNFSQLTYDRLGKILEHFQEGEILKEHQELEQLYQLGFFWDRIVSKRFSEAEVFDFTVPKNATFFGNGFVNHNTTLALHIIAEAQKAGGTAAFVDAEHALDPARAESIGVNLDELLISQPDTGEQALEIVETLVRSGAVDVIVIDSVAALVPRAEIEGEMGDAMIGVQARLMSQALRKLTAAISKSKTVVVFTNQIRHKIGVMFGNPEVTPGGLALKFYSSVRIDLRKIGQIKEGEVVVGSRHRARVVKNKVAPPFREAEFDIMNVGGISKVGNILDAATDLGIVEKSGAFLKYGKEMLGQGREAAKIFLEEHPKVARQIEEEIWKKTKTA
jgi:recombination protein RecA